MKDLKKVAVEMFVVGNVLVLIYILLKMTLEKLVGMKVDTLAKEALLVYCCGALFHLGFEILGLNEWYAKSYFAK